MELPIAAATPPIPVEKVIPSSEPQLKQKSSHLPGARGHPILRMDEATFRHTPVDEMMRGYGEAEGGPTCAMDFGNTLVNRWRDTRSNYCKRRGQSEDASSIDCFLVTQTRHHGNGDNLCVMSNVAVNMGLFADDAAVRPVVKRYVDTRHNDQPYVHFPPGFLQADCAVDTNRWDERYMPGWNADLTVKALRPLPAGQLTQVCDEWVEHNVLLIQRDTFAHFFHDSEDLVNAFLALAILRWRLADTQLYFTDLYPEGPFW